MWHFLKKYLTLDRLCKNCFNDNYILKEGYLICSKCGVIIQDLTYSNDFEPIGFLNEYQAYTIMKDIKEKKKEIGGFFSVK